MTLGWLGPFIYGDKLVVILPTNITYRMLNRKCSSRHMP